MLIKQSNNQAQKDYLCIAAIVGILFVRFFRTIVLSKPISKLFLLAHWDSLFYPLRTGQAFGMDQSVVQQYLPYRFFIAQCWRHGVPLWNKLSGFGMPLLADPQSFALSPIFALFTLFPNMQTWNIILVLELAIGAISTYLLCRELEIDLVGSFVAALLFSFCPWVQWQLELLGNGICLTPLVFLFFVRMTKRKSFWNVVFAGLVLAIDILHAHPEIAFTTAMFAVLLACLVAGFNNGSSDNIALSEGVVPSADSNMVWLASLSSAFRRIILAGAVAFGLSAPMLIPFAEYVFNGHTYKLLGATPTGIPLEALCAHYLFPFYSQGGLYLGPLSWWGLIAALFFASKGNRFFMPLIVCFLISMFAVTKLFPLSLLFNIPPFSMIYPTYCLPQYLLLMSIISGLGINCLVDRARNFSPAKLLIAGVITMVLLMVPLLITPWHHNSLSLHFDRMFEMPRFSPRIWWLNLYCSVIMLFIWYIGVGWLKRWANIGASDLIIIGLANLIIVSYSSLPIRPTFEYPGQLPLNIDSSPNSRIISIGDHLFRPNTNLVYDLPLLQVLNPLVPSGFTEFMDLCGAKIDPFSQKFSATISRMLCLTGAQTVISQQPILDESALSAAVSASRTNQLLKPQIDYLNYLSLKDIELFYDSKVRAVFIRLSAMPQGEQNMNYHLSCAIEDPQGESISFIEPQLIQGSMGSQAILCSGLLKKDVKDWQVSIRVLLDNELRFLLPSKITYGKVRKDNSWLIGGNDQAGLVTEIHTDRFKLIADHGGILQYEDSSAINHYFFAYQVQWVKQRQDALGYLKTHLNELAHTAVLERAQKQQFEELLDGMHLYQFDPRSGIFDQSGSIKNIDAVPWEGKVILSSGPALQIETPKTALLVVSDLYYPGWEVSLDGLPWKMFRADYLFRAVPIPPGRHCISFIYQPTSFIIGVGLFFATVASVLVLLGFIGRSRKQ